MMNKIEGPFYLTQDQDGHWFVVPTAHRQDFELWASLDSEDERAWQPPPYAFEVGGSPGLVVFKEFNIE